MEKFTNINLADAITEILIHAHAKEDKDVLMNTLRNAELGDSFIWICGTGIDAERDALIRDTLSNGYLKKRAEEPSILLLPSYCLEVTRRDKHSIYGNLYEQNVQEVYAFVKQNAVDSAGVTITYKSGETVRLSPKENGPDKLQTLMEKYGEWSDYRNEVANVAALQRLMQASHDSRELLPDGNFHEHLKAIDGRFINNEADRLILHLMKQEQPYRGSYLAPIRNIRGQRNYARLENKLKAMTGSLYISLYQSEGFIFVNQRPYEHDRMMVRLDRYPAMQAEPFVTSSDCNNIPVYRQTSDYASKHGESEQYIKSQHANIACKCEIEAVTSDKNASDDYLKGAAKDLVKKYGKDRIEFIFANTIQLKNGNYNYNGENRAWAASVPIKEDRDESGLNQNLLFAIVKCNDVVANRFLSFARGYDERERKPSIRAQLAEFKSEQRDTPAARTHNREEVR